MGLANLLSGTGGLFRALKETLTSEERSPAPI
jgi:hypothetical protein